MVLAPPGADIQAGDSARNHHLRKEDDELFQHLRGDHLPPIEAPQGERPHPSSGPSREKEDGPGQPRRLRAAPAMPSNATLPYYPANISERLILEYGADEKEQLYFGDLDWMKRFKAGSRKWMNSLATFHGAGPWPHDWHGFDDKGQRVWAPRLQRMHGWIGVDKDGYQQWIPKPQPLSISQLLDKAKFKKWKADHGGVQGGDEHGEEVPHSGDEEWWDAADKGVEGGWAGVELSNEERDGVLTSALKDGGFYLALSDSLTLDREPSTSLPEKCKDVRYNYDTLPDASVVITFFNEPISTLMRTVHSVLNRTPPPLLREILLVDDHSNLTELLPGNTLYELVKYLPKTKVMRLPERRGLVFGRIAGAKFARGEVVTVLDSHVEVDARWLEPQLQAIQEGGNVLTAPMIYSIEPETMALSLDGGIGCYISFKWTMIEQSSLESDIPDPQIGIRSPSMAGGLFSIRKDYFEYLGYYDENFQFWGSENVEFGFRIWMCGGEIICTPCSRTYHIYRKKGVGYHSPHTSAFVNKYRTARGWTDDHFEIAHLFISGEEKQTATTKPGEWVEAGGVDVGDMNNIIEFRESRQCENFDWYLQNVAREKAVKIDDVKRAGEIRPAMETYKNFCMDTMSNRELSDPYGLFWCHGEGGTQRWIYFEEKKWILSSTSERTCLGKEKKDEPDDSKRMRFQECSQPAAFDVVDLSSSNHTFSSNEFRGIGEPDKNPLVKFRSTESDQECLGYIAGPKLAMVPCQSDSSLWTFPRYKRMKIPPLTYTQDHLHNARYHLHPLEVCNHCKGARALLNIV